MKDVTKIKGIASETLRLFRMTEVSNGILWKDVAADENYRLYAVNNAHLLAKEILMLILESLRLEKELNVLREKVNQYEKTSSNDGQSAIKKDTCVDEKSHWETNDFEDIRKFQAITAGEVDAARDEVAFLRRGIDAYRTHTYNGCRGNKPHSRWKDCPACAWEAEAKAREAER